jgi:zinc finger CCHC domain-containing protein 9
MATPAPSTTTTTGSSAKPQKKRTPVRNKSAHKPAAKVKLTKEERRSKYTQIARDRKALTVTRHRESQLICYNCRKTGHSVHNCPDENTNTAAKDNICYACGSIEHSLAKCPNKDKFSHSALPFATCFVCQGKGHLASQCPKNDHGVYVNGGCCKYCQSVRHLATACPTKLKPDKSIAAEARAVPDVNVQDLLEGGHEQAEQRGSSSSSHRDRDNKNDNTRSGGNNTTGSGATHKKADANAKADVNAVVKAKPTQKKPKRRVVNF